MNKETILEASQWLEKLDKLNKQVESHLRLCKHWSVGSTYSVTHPSEVFPDQKYADCEFCGNPVRQ